MIQINMILNKQNFFTTFKTVIFGIVLFSFWALVSLSTKFLDKLFKIQLPQFMLIPGIIFIIIGFIIAGFCAITFIIVGKGTPAPFDAPKEFVSVGLYKFVRNPMYIGIFIMFEGFAFVNLSVFMILFPFLWLLIVHLFIIYYEEKKLGNLFGQSYYNYKNNTNRWIPKFRLNT